MSSEGIDACRLNPRPKVDEFTYPPRVHEALAFIERETAAYARKERQAERERRQAACPHEHTTTVRAATMEDPTLTMTWCDDCGGKPPELRG